MRPAIQRSLTLLSLLAAVLALSCRSTNEGLTAQDRLEAADWKVERAQARAVAAENRVRELESELVAANARIEELEKDLAAEGRRVATLREASTPAETAADEGAPRPASAKTPGDATSEEEADVTHTPTTVAVSTAALRQLSNTHDQFVRAFEQAERAYDSLHSDLRNIRQLPGHIMSEANRLDSTLSGLRRQARQVHQEIRDLTR